VRADLVQGLLEVEVVLAMVYLRIIIPMAQTTTVTKGGLYANFSCKEGVTRVTPAGFRMIRVPQDNRHHHSSSNNNSKMFSRPNNNLSNLDQEALDLVLVVLATLREATPALGNLLSEILNKKEMFLEQQTIASVLLCQLTTQI